MSLCSFIIKADDIDRTVISHVLHYAWNVYAAKCIAKHSKGYCTKLAIALSSMCLSHPLSGDFCDVYISA